MKGLNPAALLDKVRSLFSGFTGGQKAMTAIAVVAALVGARPVRVVGLQADVRPAVQRPVLHGRGRRSSTKLDRGQGALPARRRRPDDPGPAGQTSTSSGSPSAARACPPATAVGRLLAAGQAEHDQLGLPAAGDLPAGPRGRAAQDHRGDRRRRRPRSCTWPCPQEDVFTENAAVPTASVLVQTSPASAAQAGAGRGDRAPGRPRRCPAHRRPGHRRRQLRHGS